VAVHALAPADAGALDDLAPVGEREPLAQPAGLLEQRPDRLRVGRDGPRRGDVDHGALTALSLLGASALALLVWQLGRHAILQTTLALPVLSAQPCVVILALVPLAGTALGMWATRRS
jgi:hypothetical protein